ncbi:MAG: Asp-tRNA(Asn)/Glu-tRNA(Gln) amidotransferase subunit GatC [Candidatus Magasanikbacteria bacterium]
MVGKNKINKTDVKLNEQEIEKIAKLARLELTSKEKKMYAEQLSVVLDYVEILNEVDTEGVEETCQVTGLEDVVREDEVHECGEETKEKIIDAFPEKVGELLKVKAVFAEEE